MQWPWFLVNTMDKIKRFGILDNEQKKQVMKKMRSDSKADFVDVVIETIKQKRRKVMATPNLINVDTITPKVQIQAVTTSRADIIDVAAEYCAKVNSLIIANIDGSNAADITVEVSIDNGSNYFAIASTVSVPADASIVVIGKDNGIYLDETDLLAVTASANSDLVACVSYELMKDA